MLEDSMVLWKHRLMRDIKNGNNGSIKPNEIMHESLSALAHFLENDSRQWSIARIVCRKGDAVADEASYPGWYVAIREIPAKEGFLPFYEAAEKYSDYM